jgi:hypothetical protein
MVMTTQGAGALIPGALNKEEKMATQLVKAIRGFYFRGKPVNAGKTVDLPAGFAMEMIAAGKAEEAKPEPKDETKAETKAEPKSRGKSGSEQD